MRISRQMAFCGLTCALILSVLLLSIFPYASVAIAALAGAFVIPVSLELGARYGVACYVASSILAFLLIPDIQAKWLYLTFFGFYPIVKFRVDLWFRKWLIYTVKYIIFNASLVAYTAVQIAFIGIPEESLFSEYRWLFIPAVILLNGLFWIFDTALTSVFALYRVRFHPFIKRLFH